MMTVLLEQEQLLEKALVLKEAAIFFQTQLYHQEDSFLQVKFGAETQLNS